jgi:two-component system, OmpR family, alkaline phosphatase synthesis response regulator PhoP
VLRRQTAHALAALHNAPAGTPSQATDEQRRFGTVTIDTEARLVHRGGEPVPLTATEFDILACFAANPGRVLTRGEIQQRVWGPGHHGTVRTIDNFMMQLRTKLEDDPSRPEHLITVRGVGYRFNP